MDCATCHELLVDFLYGDLDEHARAELEDALARCAECRQELEALKRLREQTRSVLVLPEQGLSEARRAAILSAAREAVRVGPVAETASNAEVVPFFRRPLFTFALAACLVGGLSAAILLSERRDPVSSEREHAAQIALAEPVEESAAPASMELSGAPALAPAAVGSSSAPQGPAEIAQAGEDETAQAQASAQSQGASAIIALAELDLRQAPGAEDGAPSTPPVLDESGSVRRRVSVSRSSSSGVSAGSGLPRGRGISAGGGGFSGGIAYREEVPTQQSAPSASRSSTERSSLGSLADSEESAAAAAPIRRAQALDRESEAAVLPAPQEAPANEADGHFEAGRYREAALAYEALFDELSGSELARAVYRAGISRQGMGDPRRALLHFDRYLAEWPQGAQASDVRVRRARISGAAVEQAEPRLQPVENGDR